MNRFLEHHFADLIDLIYEAAVDQTRWDAVLDALPTAFDNGKGCLITWGAQTGPRTRTFGLDAEFSRTYDQHYGAVDPFRVAGVEHAPYGQMVRSIDVVPKDTLLKHEFYNDWMIPQAMPLDHFGANLGRDPATAVVIAVAPDAGMYERQPDQYHRQFELLLPHLCRAVAINKQVARSARFAGALGGSVDALGRGRLRAGPQLGHAVRQHARHGIASRRTIAPPAPEWLADHGRPGRSKRRYSASHNKLIINNISNSVVPIC